MPRAALLSLLLLLSACGQSGDLYLPDAKPVPNQTPQDPPNQEAR